MPIEMAFKVYNHRSRTGFEETMENETEGFLAGRSTHRNPEGKA